MGNEKIHDLAYKIEYICRREGVMISGFSNKVYSYFGLLEDLELHLIENKIFKKKFKNILARNSEYPVLFDYFISISSKNKGKIHYFQEGLWEKLVEKQYQIVKELERFFLN